MGAYVILCGGMVSVGIIGVIGIAVWVGVSEGSTGIGSIGSWDVSLIDVVVCVVCTCVMSFVHGAAISFEWRVWSEGG